MKAIVTGASSGIGRDIAKVLSNMGYEIYGVARREDRLRELSAQLKTKFTPVVLDLAEEENIYKLFEIFKDEEIDIIVNNAGFGVFGNFTEIPLERELELINVNVRALHILTKLFAKKFLSQGHGKILNVASVAGFMMGPLLSTYYASKAYALRLSEAVDEELRRQNKNVTVSVLCPGPVKTEFDKVANVSLSLSGLESEYVAKYAVKKMFKGKRVIVPGALIKSMLFVSRFVPGRLLSKIVMFLQRKKAN